MNSGLGLQLYRGVPTSYTHKGTVSAGGGFQPCNWSAYPFSFEDCLFGPSVLVFFSSMLPVLSISLISKEPFFCVF
jgi:hypothetical protein